MESSRDPGPFRTPSAGRLAGRTAVVVGAGAVGPGWGNGRAAAALYAHEGADVVIVDRDAASLEETAAAVRDAGSEPLVLTADIGEAGDVEWIVASTLQERGRIDVLHNNVGILRTGGTLEQTPQDWDLTLRVNLTGTWLMCRAAIPAMREAGRGSIVNVASVAGIRHLGVSYAGYSASKAGVLALTQSTAIDLAPEGIRANAVLPGLMDTPMVAASLSGAYDDHDVDELRRTRAAQVPMGHMGDAWDVAYACLFLACDESSYVTGTTLVVDGGLTAKC